MKKELFQFVQSPVLGALVVCLSLLSSCAKYTPHSFSKPLDAMYEKEDVQVSVEEFGDGDCFYYFSRRAASKGYQPIKLFIKNSSTKTYILEGRDIDLQMESKHQVGRALKINVEERVAGWGIAGLFIWPFLIPAIVDGVRAHDANKKMINDFDKRVIDYESRIVIAPGTSANRVIFVARENAVDRFSFTLKDRDTEEILSFDVNV